ncbi:hypothetical protein H7347_00295 [Corynebacterium sp. zg-331]|uniref:hypothetical protein n=1 Tax=unclassified Corynebacterium TaxID=2624378 RepID=UPI00128B7ECE|nr:MULTISPECIES: hypothetical protein [unclassified Corynebacterium]MBC3185036.1 hypothetical protein [Corynebacterium sp. zg-331]MPV51536.1 hypothetical protein [Corynebacterium sp. zg331]
MNTIQVAFRRAGTMNLATSSRINEITQEAHQRNRTRTARAYTSVGNSIRQAFHQYGPSQDRK